MALVLHKVKPLAAQPTKSPILTALKKEVSIKNMIHKELAGWEPARQDDHIHASDLFGDHEYCPREWAFYEIGAAKRKDQYVGTSLRITFDFGRDLENNIRNNWIRDYMVGHWKCDICGHVHPVFGKAPKIKCPKCGWGHKWVYKEVRIFDPETGVSGGIDGFVDVGQPKLRILEIKSLDKDYFKKLVAPMAEHKVRTSLYLRLAEKDEAKWTDRVYLDEAQLLYASKSFGFKDTSLKEAGVSDAGFSPFKEYPIKRDDSLLGNSMIRAKVLTHWRKVRDTQPNAFPAGVCINGLCKRAQKCHAVGPCWSGHHLGTITWVENESVKHPGKPIVVTMS